MSQDIISQDEASRIAKKEIFSIYEKSIELIPTKLSKGDVYDFDPDGWTVFCWMDRMQIGATDYCAVNLATGEFRHLGKIGE